MQNGIIVPQSILIALQFILSKPERPDWETQNLFADVF